MVNKKIKKALENIFKKTKAESMFIYGSRARNDYKEDSDYEIGILYKKENKVSRSEIAKLHNLEKVNIYPFVVEEMERYNFDTPFPKAIYLRELIGNSKTIFGENILEKMELPEIRLTDLLERAAFDLATAFAAFRSFESGDLMTASVNFKSILFGTRILEILELKKFPFTYDEIFELSKELDLLPKYRELIDNAYRVRKGKKIEEQFIFTGITYLNQEVLVKIKRQIIETGDRIILKGKKIDW